MPPETTMLYGDAWELAKTLEPQSIDCIVTSPPYWGLRDYGHPGQFGLEKTPQEYVAKLVDLFARLRPALKDCGTVWLNLGDSYASGGRTEYDTDDKSVARGGNFRPGSGRADGFVRAAFPRNRNGTPAAPGLKAKDLCGMPWRVAFALQADGWYLRSDIIWAKPNPMPESVTDRPTKAHEYIFLLSKNARYYFDQEAVREPSNGLNDHDLTGPGYSAPGQSPNRGNREGKNERTGNRRLVGFNARWDATEAETAKRRSKMPDGWATHAGDHGTIHRDGREKGAPSEIPFGRNIRTVWTIPTQPYPEAHFATFPEAIPERCIKAGCPEGGTVLDPFAGSGTTLYVARKLGRNSIGFELNEAYRPLIEKRLQQEVLV